MINDQIPNITILVPAYNEEENIKEKMDNLLEIDYPKEKRDIIFINDHSTDSTLEKANKYPIKIINLEKREGKIKAINKGIELAKTDIIVMTDADTILEKDSIKNLISYFNNKIGAVTGNIQLKIKPSFYSIGQKYFQDVENKVRYYEGLLDSVNSLDGRLCAFKKSIIPKINEKATADDIELAFQIRRKGYKCVFAKNAISYEEPPNNFKEEFKQKRRRTSHMIKVTIAHINMLLNPKYGFFGILTFPFRRFFTLFLPFLIITLIIFYPKTLYLTILMPILLLTKNIRSIIIYNSLVLVAIALSWLHLKPSTALWNTR